MDKIYSITISAERKRGQHLGAEERGIIQELHKLGYSNRAIAREQLASGGQSQNR